MKDKASRVPESITHTLTAPATAGVFYYLSHLYYVTSTTPLRGGREGSGPGIKTAGKAAQVASAGRLGGHGRGIA